MIKITTKMLVALCTFGLLVGLAVGYIGEIIWSGSSGPTTATTQTTLSSVSWQDTTQPTLSKNPVNIHTGDSLTLSTTITPTTTNTQTVTFYYTNVVDPTSSIPVGTNPASQLVIAGTGTGTSTVSCSWVVPADGTYYFIAKLVIA